MPLNALLTKKKQVPLVQPSERDDTQCVLAAQAIFSTVIRSLAGLLMEIMNFSFCVRVTFIYLFTPTSSCYYFLKNKTRLFCMLGNLFAEGSPGGAVSQRECSQVAKADRKRMTRLRQLLLRKWLAKGRQFSRVSQGRSRLAALPTSPVTAAPLA